MYGSWQELVHPLGGTYYFHNTKVSTYQLYKMRLHGVNLERAYTDEFKTLYGSTQS